MQQQFENTNEQNGGKQSSYNWGAAIPKPRLSFATRALIKGFITAMLILFLLVPTFFVHDLVNERLNRQQEVAAEVKRGWATEQTLYGPYLYLPYTVVEKDKIVEKNLFILPENLTVNGDIIPEVRHRSIYNVLLYKSTLSTKGNFNIKLPANVAAENVQFNKAALCYSLTDLKGVEEKLNINFNNSTYNLLPGLPFKETETVEHNTSPTTSTTTSTYPVSANVIGLSSNINLSASDLSKEIPFACTVKVKGSEQLHFIPLSANSSYSLQSSWANPKFDGSDLPSINQISNNGFSAKWNFTPINLPYTTTLTDFGFNKSQYAFGVSMLQPTDHYAKTMRSVKYAILFIGLTFALFFIIELLQKKPMHPVQYVLIGFALVIFFTLLLSISEFLHFDWAYIISAVATILLITLYANSHFKNAKTASIFGLFLSFLYAFIFVLIRLEDAALLIGSIGLFIILAVIMYVSRKINWYNN